MCIHSSRETNRHQYTDWVGQPVRAREALSGRVWGGRVGACLCEPCQRGPSRGPGCASAAGRFGSRRVSRFDRRDGIRVGEDWEQRLIRRAAGRRRGGVRGVVVICGQPVVRDRGRGGQGAGYAAGPAGGAAPCVASAVAERSTWTTRPTRGGARRGRRGSARVGGEGGRAGPTAAARFRVCGRSARTGSGCSSAVSETSRRWRRCCARPPSAPR